VSTTIHCGELSTWTSKKWSTTVGQGPSSNFTAVRIDPLSSTRSGSRGCASVTFGRRRTAWHTHPLGDLIVTVLWRAKRVGRLRISSR